MEPGKENTSKRFIDHITGVPSTEETSGRQRVFAKAREVLEYYEALSYSSI